MSRPERDWLEWVRPERDDPDAQPTPAQRAELAADPALRAELARRTRFDAAAAAAVQAVPAPAGWAGRLSARAAPPRRRRWAWAAAAAAALVVAGAWWRFGPERNWTPDRIAAEVLAFHQETLAFAPAPAEDVRAWLPARFDPQWLAGGGEVRFLGRTARIVKLRRGTQSATLALLPAHAFPWGFDFQAYLASGPGEPEVVFLPADGIVCVAAARGLAAFELQDAAL